MKEICFQDSEEAWWQSRTLAITGTRAGNVPKLHGLYEQYAKLVVRQKPQLAGIPVIIVPDGAETVPLPGDNCLRLTVR